jgi:glycosyltransferase involved in cell wall biosynthesis
MEDMPRIQALMLGLASAGAISYLLNLALHGNSTLTWINLGVTICLVIGWAACALKLNRSDQSTHFVAADSALPVAEMATVGYSIIIPTFNRANDVCRLVETIIAFIKSEIPGQTAEIIVVDDGSTDTTVADLALAQRAHATSINVVSQKNSGVASARNHGALQARGRVLIYIDSDCLPQSGWLSKLAQSASEGGVAYTRVEGERVPYYPLEVSPFEAKFPGASFAVHRDDYLGLGGMCELFGHHLEDSDFYLKCVEGGLEIISVQDAVIWHPLRRRSLCEIWRNALLHSYDALLLRRHGKSSYPFLRNAFAGVNVGPYYGSTLTTVVLLGEGILASFFSASGTSILQWLFLICVAGVVYVTGIMACALYLRVPILLWPRYFGTVFTYMTGSVVGRVRGSWKYRILVL